MTWTFHSRKYNNKINNLHESALRIVYDDYTSSFNELLDRDGSFSVHRNNIQTLAIEIYKVMHNLSEGIIFNEIFTARTYNGPSLRAQSKLQPPHVNSVNNGENSLRFFGPIVWNILPTSIKNIDSLHDFKRLIKNGNLLIVLAGFADCIYLIGRNFGADLIWRKAKMIFLPRI